MIVLLVLLVIVVVLAFFGVYVVPQQSIYIIERLGKFHKVSGAGIHAMIPFIDRRAAIMDMRIRQLENTIVTKTKDDTFVSMEVAVQFRIDKNRVYEAFYELSSPQAQIKSYIEDSMRNSVPGITLDEAFSQKDQIASDVKKLLEDKMTQYGYIIVSTLITDIQPDKAVVNAMNSINEAQRKREAAKELAEAEKITIVTKAEAQRDEMRLHGEGVAQQRKAIIDGLMESVDDLSKTGLSAEQIMSVILANQYIDVLDGFTESPNTKVLFVDNQPTGIDGIRNNIISALEAGPKSE